jgi:hypothetical protein
LKGKNDKGKIIHIIFQQIVMLWDPNINPSMLQIHANSIPKVIELAAEWLGSDQRIHPIARTPTELAETISGC